MLQHSLSNNRMFTQKYFVNRIQSKIPSFKRNKMKRNNSIKEGLSSIDNEPPNPADVIDSLIKEYSDKAAKTTKNFNKMNEQNNIFISGYKLFKNKHTDERLFRSHPLLMKSQSELNLFMIGKGILVNI